MTEQNIENHLSPSEDMKRILISHALLDQYVCGQCAKLYEGCIETLKRDLKMYAKRHGLEDHCDRLIVLGSTYSRVVPLL